MKKLKKNQKKPNKIMIVFLVLIGFIGLMLLSLIITFKNYELYVEDNNFSITLKENVQENTKLKKEAVSKKTFDVAKVLEKKFSIKNNLASIIIAIIVFVFYLYIKRRNKNYVKREED